MCVASHLAHRALAASASCRPRPFEMKSTASASNAFAAHTSTFAARDNIDVADAKHVRVHYFVCNGTFEIT